MSYLVCGSCKIRWRARFGQWSQPRLAWSIPGRTSRHWLTVTFKERNFPLNTILYHLNIVIHARLKHFIIIGLPIYVLRLLSMSTFTVSHNQASNCQVNSDSFSPSPDSHPNSNQCPKPTGEFRSPKDLSPLLPSPLPTIVCGSYHCLYHSTVTLYSLAHLPNFLLG